MANATLGAGATPIFDMFDADLCEHSGLENNERLSLLGDDEPGSACAHHFPFLDYPSSPICPSRRARLPSDANRDPITRHVQLSSPLPSANDEVDDSSAASLCWGAILKDDPTGCAEDFLGGKGHFKNKFCTRCKEGIDVPVARVRAVPRESLSHLQNRRVSGFWKALGGPGGASEVRLANNTIQCDGPWLAIYRTAPPNLEESPLPDAWVTGDVIRLVVARGTLVPASEMIDPNKRTKRTKDAHSLPKRQRRASNHCTQVASSGQSAALFGTGGPIFGHCVSLAERGDGNDASLSSSRASTQASPSGSIPGSPRENASALRHTTATPIRVTPAVPFAPFRCSATLFVPAAHVAAEQPPEPASPDHLASRLLFSYQHLAAVLESSLHPGSTLQHQLSHNDAAVLSGHLDFVQSAIFDVRNMSRVPHSPH
jgi:hypothetical protein